MPANMTPNPQSLEEVSEEQIAAYLQSYFTDLETFEQATREQLPAELYHYLSALCYQYNLYKASFENLEKIVSETQQIKQEDL